MSTDLEPEEVQVKKRTFFAALMLVRQSLPEEKLDDFDELVTQINDLIKTGERIDLCELCATLMDPKKFGVKQEIVEEFLRHLAAGHPAEERLISGTIECAKRMIWRRRQ